MEILGRCVTQGDAMATTVLFQDNFSTNGPLNSANWDFNRWEATNNPSYLGLTQMRQSLPVAENGMARIRLDTWLDGNAFSGSEAITIQAFALPGQGGGIAFEAKLKFEGTQGGMIAGFFTFQKFPPGADRDIHDEIERRNPHYQPQESLDQCLCARNFKEDSSSPIDPCHTRHVRGLAYLPDGVVSGPRQMVP